MEFHGIEKNTLFSLSHYTYGEAYFGSIAGMRFRVAAEPLKDFHKEKQEEWGEVMLSFSVWPEPMSYAATPKEEIIATTFPFSEEGFSQGVDWMNERYKNLYL